MKVLITGVAGLLGSRMAEWILTQHPTCQIIGIDDFSTAPDDPVHPYEVMQAVTTFLQVNKEWKVRFFSFGTESLQNIYISRIFDSETNA